MTKRVDEFSRMRGVLRLADKLVARIVNDLTAEEQDYVLPKILQRFESMGDDDLPVKVGGND